MAHSPAKGLHLRCCRPPTRSSIYLYLTFEPYNSVFQTLLCPEAYLFRVFFRSSLISLRFRGVLWLVGPSSIPVQCFSWKGGPFPCKIKILWYFLDFQRRILVRSASLTNKKPSGGVLCYYCHNPGHVRQKCKRLQCKNRRFQSS